ncbi:response regulator of citrate/malate metabolism [Bradyrhizobium sp. LM2.7]
MAPRKTTTVEKLETALTELRSRHSTLNERKVEAQTALDQATADQQKFFLESDISDDGAIAKVENALNAAMLRLSSLSDACAAVEAQIADAADKLRRDRARGARSRGRGDYGYSRGTSGRA